MTKMRKRNSNSRRIRWFAIGVGLACAVSALYFPALASKIYTCTNDTGDPVYGDTPCVDRDSEEIRLNQEANYQNIRYRYRHEADRYRVDQGGEPAALGAEDDFPSEQLYNFDQLDPETTPVLAEELGPTERYTMALRQAKSDCGDRYNGRSEEQLIKFSSMLEGLESDQRRDSELEEINCHLDFLVRINRLKAED
jgi:hypothetical protein